MNENYIGEKHLIYNLGESKLFYSIKDLFGNFSIYSTCYIL